MNVEWKRRCKAHHCSHEHRKKQKWALRVSGSLRLVARDGQRALQLLKAHELTYFHVYIYIYRYYCSNVP